MSDLPDKRRLEIIAQNISGFWQTIAEDLDAHFGKGTYAALAKSMEEDVASLREIAERMP